MARTKGAVAKPKVNVESTNENSKSNDGEIVETKRRGRQPGSPAPEREPNVIIELNKDYRIKMDKWNYTLQEKGKEKQEEVDTEAESEDKEDTGWKSIGYYPTRIQGLESVCNKLITELTIKKARKELILSIERYLELLDKSAKEVSKMFGQHDYSVIKKG